MDKHVNYLNRLIESANLQGHNWSTGTEQIAVNIYRNENGSVLIFIGDLKKEIEAKYLSNYDVISKREVFLRFFSGCVGPSTIVEMLKSFDDYHHKCVPDDISNFLLSLEASKVIICFSDSYGSSKAALVILYKICQKIKLDCIPIIMKPALFKRNNCYRRDFKDLLNHLDTHIYHIYDENLLVYKQTKELTTYDFRVAWESEILELAVSIMESPNLWGTSKGKYAPDSQSVTGG